MTKAEIRREMRTRLASLGPARAGKSQAIVAALLKLPVFAGPRPGHLAIFSPLPSEPDIEPLWQSAPGAFCYPRVDGDRMQFVAVEKIADLTVSPWHPQIREHSLAEARVVSPSEIDAILVPGLAFTEDGHRLGRGGGYYDRYLATLPARAVKIGVCFGFQLVSVLPVEIHDVRMNCVVTEEATFI